MVKRKPKNLLTGKTASVSLSRGGLTISIESVQAPDAAQAAQAILNAFRGLVDAGYDELREQGPMYHGGAFQVDEDEDIDVSITPPESRSPRVIGFRV